MSFHQQQILHRCEMCHGEGTFFGGAVVCIGKAPIDGFVVAQCPRCKRILCNDHAEHRVADLGSTTASALGLEEIILATSFVPTILCCPFDRTPLGWPPPEESLGVSVSRVVVLVNRDGVTDAERQQWARVYLQNTAHYVWCLNGVDLAAVHWDEQETSLWPMAGPGPGRWHLRDRLLAATRAEVDLNDPGATRPGTPLDAIAGPDERRGQEG